MKVFSLLFLLPPQIETFFACAQWAEELSRSTDF